jgi:hypothetical protein
MNFEIETGETPLSNAVTNLAVNPGTPGPTGPIGLSGSTGPMGPSSSWENFNITFNYLGIYNIGTVKKVGSKVFWSLNLWNLNFPAGDFVYITNCPPALVPTSGSITTMPILLVNAASTTSYVFEGRLDASGLAIVDSPGTFPGSSGLYINFTYNLTD